MRSKKVKSAIKGLESLSPSETDILIALEYIEKLEKQDEKDFTTIYIKGCVDKDAFWRDKIRDKIKELEDLLNTCNKKEDIERIKGLNERILVLEEIIEGEK